MTTPDNAAPAQLAGTPWGSPAARSAGTQVVAAFRPGRPDLTSARVPPSRIGTRHVSVGQPLVQLADAEGNKRQDGIAGRQVPQIDRQKGLAPPRRPGVDPGRGTTPAGAETRGRPASRGLSPSEPAASLPESVPVSEAHKASGEQVSPVQRARQKRSKLAQSRLATHARTRCSDLHRRMVKGNDRVADKPAI